MTSSTSTITITEPQIKPCPAWCTVEHELPGAFHAGPNITEGTAYPVRLWQADQEGATAGIVVAGELLTDGQAHDLGLALVRAADVLRRARMAAER